MASDIALSLDQRTSLINLRSIDDYIGRTQRRLSTGLEVSEVTDGVSEYFAARRLNNASESYSTRRDAIDQSVSAIQNQLDTISTVDSLLEQLRSLTIGARSENTAQRYETTSNFVEIGEQILQVLNDNTYQGINLLSDSNAQLRTFFSDAFESRQVVQGVDIRQVAVNEANVNTQVGTNTYLSTQIHSATDRGGIFNVAFLETDGSIAVNLNAFVFDENLNALYHEDQVSAGVPSSSTVFQGFHQLAATEGGEINLTANLEITDLILEEINAARRKLETIATNFGHNLNVLETRISHSESVSDTYKIGADKLTLADLNSEGAALTALRTRNQISVENLNVSAEQHQQVLLLLR